MEYYTVAAIANEDPLKVGILAAKVLIPSFLISFAFVLNSNILLQGIAMICWNNSKRWRDTRLPFWQMRKVLNALLIFGGILMINPEVYSACTKVLTYTLTPEYKNIQILLQTGQDKINETC